MTNLLWRVLFLLLALQQVAQAQVYVAPRRPGKSVVRYFEHDWKQIDMLVGQKFGDEESKGLRLYFYEQEREPAEKAAALIEQAYRQLAEDFGVTPPRRFAFVLYGSYQEFLRTNLFPLQEGVLGVTSTKTLALTLPWFGDAERFAEVCTHELAHEFTIQKEMARSKGRGDALARVPLWFVEGLAELYAKRGLDAEARMLLTDLVANPRLELGYGLADFWVDAPGSVLWTYKIGLARVVFLEETYGKGTVQRILDALPGLLPAGMSTPRQDKDFAAVVERVTGDKPELVSEKFEEWAKKSGFEGWKDARTRAAQVQPLEHVRGYADAIAASPDGDVLLYRTADPHTGRYRLMLVDPRASRSPKGVAEDGRPGLESLHPVEDRNFDLGASRLVYVAETRGHDVLYWQDWSRKARRPRVEPPSLTPGEEPAPAPDPWVVRFKLGRKEVFDLGPHGMVAAFTPKLSPDGGRVAFVGLDAEGERDLWVLDLDKKELRRLTEDAYAERGLAWAADGIVYGSDATETGETNLFRVPPEGGPVTRLTSEPRDHLDPAVLPDGRVVFVAWEDGKADLWTVLADGVAPLTDVDTAFSNPSPAPGGGVWVMHRDEGERVPVRVAKAELIEGTLRPSAPTGPAAPIPTSTLEGATDYRALAASNWKVEDVFALVGAGSGVIVGQALVSASDELRDHVVQLEVSTYGDLRLTDGYLAWIDQSGRTTWGGGPFHFLRFRVDQSVGDEVLFQTGERFYGGVASWRYPFDRFVHLQIDEAIGASASFLFDDTATGLAQLGLLDEWQAANAGAPLQSETTLRFGFDTIRYHSATGPLAGASSIVAGTWGVRPMSGEMYGSVRVDGEQYFPVPVGEGANFGLRAAAGTGLGERLAPSFWLSSYDTLRGVPYGDTDFLLGRHFWFARGELQVPITAILRVAFLTNIEAVAGMDFGAVSSDYGDLWDDRLLDVALGGNFVLGPLVLRVHFAHPLDVGAPLPEDQGPWVPNVSLGWIGG